MLPRHRRSQLRPTPQGRCAAIKTVTNGKNRKTRGGLYREDLSLEGSRLNWIANFIWGIADDVLPRPLRPRQVPGCDLAHDRAAAARLAPGAEQAGRAGDEGHARQGEDHPPGPGTASGRRPGVSTTHRSSHCATSRPAPANSSSRPTSRRISTASRRTSRTSWRSSSFGTRSHACPRPMSSAR